MKKLLLYVGVILAVVILLPLLIVKGCNYTVEEPSESPDLLIEEKILVYDHSSRTVKNMDLEEYLKEVVAAEMPADFDIEALKAQAVAARTFAYSRKIRAYRPEPGVHDEADICTDYKHCQAWISRGTAMKKWGIFNASRNWNKISRAVNETKGLIITYDSKVINALFHANSGGKTENIGDVWDGVQVPYLKSVESNGEDAAKDFKSTVIIKIKDFIGKLKNEYPDIKLSSKNVPGSIKILEYTEGGRVKTLKAGDIIIKGTDFRKLMELRSANFKIEKAGNDSIKITTLGYGHGVGLSQWGANYLAKRGGTFDEIVKYYYTGVEITSIKDYIKLVGD
ncbi:MAG: stage II sporulation protein D [Ruminiclostridium sp.]|nr:stage II sporulation protein D [Ruminiclostridium sp.]